MNTLTSNFKSSVREGDIFKSDYTDQYYIIGDTGEGTYQAFNLRNGNRWGVPECSPAEAVAGLEPVPKGTVLEIIVGEEE